MLLDDLLLRLDAAAPRPVAVELAGVGTVYVLPLTVGDMNQSDAEAAQATDRPTVIARGAARLLCDEKGVRYWQAGSDETNEALVAKLRSISWDALQPLLAAARGSVGAGNV